MGLAQGLSDMQQGLENYAKAQKEAVDSQAKAAGNRNLLNTFVNEGIWGAQEVADYNKGNARFRDEMVASGARAYQIKAQQAEQQRAAESAKRAAESIQLEKDRMGRHVWEYDQEQKVKEENRQKAIEFLNRGPQLKDVPVEGGGMKAVVTREGGFDILPESPQQKENERQLKLAEEQKRLSETKTRVKDPITGNTIWVDPDHPLAKRAQLAADPSLEAKDYYNLRPQDFFNSSIHQRGNVNGNAFEPDKNGPMIKIGGAKPMPVSEFDEFKNRFQQSGMAPPPPPEPTPGSASGITKFLQNIMYPGMTGGSGAAPSPSPAPAGTSQAAASPPPTVGGGRMPLDKDTAQAFINQAAKMFPDMNPQDIKATAAKMAAANGYDPGM